MELGFQVSSLKPCLTSKEEVFSSFEKLHQIGYRAVQIQWISPQVPDEAVAEALDRFSLSCIAVQDFYTEVLSNLERYRTQNRLWKSRYMTVSRIPQEYFSAEGLPKFAHELRRLAELFGQDGVTLSFHPVSGDYAPIDGQCAVDKLMDLLPSEIQLTLCLYHTIHGGQDPCDFLRRYSGRVDLVHFKNSAVFPDGEEFLVPVGQGNIDWPPILRACWETGVKWGFAEQERWRKDPFVCAEESYRYLVENGVKNPKI